MGLISIELRSAIEIVTVVEPLMLPDVAVILAVPASRPSTRPLSETVAIAVFEEDHVTDPVIFFSLPSLYVPVAVICRVLLIAIDGVCGVTAILLRVGSTKNLPQPIEYTHSPAIMRIRFIAHTHRAAMTRMRSEEVILISPAVGTQGRE